MAKLLWGKVYYQDQFAGILSEEPGHSISFIYDQSYLSGRNPPIAHTLPLKEEPFISQRGLLPFFDNLVSEGWLEVAQKRLLNRKASRFELLLAFGYDCIGAVSVLDPDPAKLQQTAIDMTDMKEVAVMTSRASLSGVQPKLALIEKDGKFYPTQAGELSTHIAKFPSPTREHDDIVYNEYLTSLAFQTLLPDDSVAQLQIGFVDGLGDESLIIKRFDRGPGGKRLHFEEFNQLLGYTSQDKYEGAYEDMAHFISTTPGCLGIETYRLFLRVLAGLLLGNTDMHLKNFSMFHTEAGLRLTPSYDQLSAVLYGYKNIALSMNGSKDLMLGNLHTKALVRLGERFGLKNEAIRMAFKHLNIHRESAKEQILSSPYGHFSLKNKLINIMDARWNGTFASTGAFL